MVARVSLVLVGLVAGCNAVAGLDGLSFEAGSTTTTTTTTTSGGLGGQGGVMSASSVGGGRASCPPGLGDCDGVESNGCEQSLADAAHCGRCDRACETECSDEGLCAPDVLHEGLDGPQGMTLVGDTLYVCDFPAGHVLQMHQDGLGQPMVLVPNVAGCAGIHHDQNFLYIASFTNDEVLRTTFDGGGRIVLYSGDGVHGIEIVGDDIYWTEHNAQFVRYASKSGSTVTPNVVGDANQLSRPTSVAFAGNRAIFPDFGTGIIWAGDGQGPPVSLASGYLNPFYVTADDTHLYWTVASRDNPADGRVMRLLIDGSGDPEVFAHSIEVPSGIVIGDTYVYFALEATGKVVRVPK